MLQLDRFKHLLKLSLLLNFFLFGISWFITYFLIALVDLVRDSFLHTLVSVLNKLLGFILLGLTYFTVVYGIIATVVILAIFFIELNEGIKSEL